MIPRTGRRVLGLGLAAAVGLLPALPGPAGAAAPPALVRVAHLSPDGPAVDVLIDGRRIRSGLKFTAVSAYVTVPGGRHDIEVRGQGLDLSAHPDLAAGSAHTFAAMGTLAKPLARMFTDRLGTPPAGKGSVRVVHAAPGVPPADVVAQTGAVLYQDIAFGQDPGYRSLPGGSYAVTMRRAGTGDVLLAARGIAVQPGTVYSIWAVGGGGKPLSLVRTRDAAGVGRVPAGGAATGYGGTAPGGNSGGAAGGALLLGVIVLAAGATWRSARRTG